MKARNRKVGWVLLALLLVALPDGFSKGKVIDEVVAVVGNEMILSSEIEQELMQQKVQGMIETEDTRCEMLEQLLIQKLLLTQAKIDSLKVNEDMVEQEVDQRVRFFVTQLGSIAEVEKYFGKSMVQLKKDLKVHVREKNLTSQMQNNIIKDVAVTPHDVQDYYARLKPDSFPMVPEQYVLQQVVVMPPSGAEARFEVREKLIELRERIIAGEQFKTLAVMYSEDPGSAKRGGELGLAPKESYVKAFSEVAFALKPGQVSQVVETEFGYHIIQMVSREGDMANLRHILMKPKFTTESQAKAMHRLDSITRIVQQDSMTFEAAARAFSEDDDTRVNGGYVVNPHSNTVYFEKDQLQPADYFELKNMKVGEISKPFQSKDNKGNDIYKIMKLKEIVLSHRANVTQDYVVVSSIALSNKQEDKFKGWIKERIPKTIVRLHPSVQSCKFDYEGWVR